MDISFDKKHKVSKTHKISISNAFAIFILGTMGILGAVFFALIAFSVRLEFASIKSQDHKSRSRTIQHLVEVFLDQHAIVLQDHASFPMMIQAVMQPQENLSRTANFIDTLLFFGKDYQLSLLDCFGNTIYSTLKSPHYDYTQNPWVNGDHSDTLYEVSQSKESFYWRLVMPILYNDATEGFLVVEIPLAEVYQAAGLDNLLENSHMALIWQGEIINSYGQPIEHEGYLISLNKLDLEILYSPNIDNFIDARNALELRLVIALCVAIAISTVGAYGLGRLAFVKPLETLRTLTKSLAANKIVPIARHERRIKEINSLQHDFLNMIRQVKLREKALQKARDTLEIRVQERTKELENNRKRLETLVEAIPDLVWLKDIRGTYVFCNTRVERLFGRRKDEILGGTDYDFLDRSTADFCISNDKKVITLDKMVVSEETLTYADDGHTEILEIVKAPVKDAENQIVGVLAIARDVTRRKQAEELLKAKSEELERYFSSSLDLLCIADTEGRFIRLNPEWERTLGYSLEELEGHSFLDFVHPDDLTCTKQAIADLVNQKEVVRFVNRYISKNGTYRWIEWQSKPMGSLIYAVARNITERKLLELSLQEHKKMLSWAQHYARAGVWKYDIQSSSLHWSSECESLFGLNEGEFEGTYEAFLSYVHPEDKEYVRKINQPLIQSVYSGPLEYDHRIIKKNGDICWVRESAGIIYDEAHNPFTLIGFVIDITAQKNAEDELRKLNENLELEVCKRTKELKLSQDQLRQLYVRLQSSQELERKQIAREIHDVLGTVLTVLKYDISWVKRNLHKASSTLVKKLEMMSEMTDSIIKNIQDICTQLRPGVLDDMGLVAAMEWHVKKITESTGLKIKMDCDENIILTQECTTSLFRVFQELLTNVMRHAKAKQVQICLTQQQGNVVFTMEDDGVGISHKKIGSPQSLGLTGIYERINIYRGTFKISRSDNKGTLATITIPID